MTKATLTALGAALIALGQELQGEEATPTTEKPATTRRGKAPPETTAPAGDSTKQAEGKTAEELRGLCEPLIKRDLNKMKTLISKHGGTKLSDLPVANQPAFLQEVKDCLRDLEASDI